MKSLNTAANDLSMYRSESESKTQDFRAGATAAPRLTEEESVSSKLKSPPTRTAVLKTGAKKSSLKSTKRLEDASVVDVHTGVVLRADDVDALFGLAADVCSNSATAAVVERKSHTGVTETPCVPLALTDSIQTSGSFTEEPLDSSQLTQNTTGSHQTVLSTSSMGGGWEKRCDRAHVPRLSLDELLGPDEGGIDRFLNSDGIAAGPYWILSEEGCFDERGILSAYGTRLPAPGEFVGVITRLGISDADETTRRALVRKYHLSGVSVLKEAIIFLSLNQPLGTLHPKFDRLRSSVEENSWIMEGSSSSLIAAAERRVAEERPRPNKQAIVPFAPIAPPRQRPPASQPVNVLNPDPFSRGLRNVGAVPVPQPFGSTELLKFECYRVPRQGAVGLLLSWVGRGIDLVIRGLGLVSSGVSSLIKAGFRLATGGVPTISRAPITFVALGTQVELETRSRKLLEPRVLLRPEGFENSLERVALARVRSLFGVTSKGMVRHSTITPYQMYLMDAPKSRDVRMTSLSGVAINETPQLIVEANMEDHGTGITRTVLYSPQLVDQVLTSLRMVPGPHRESLFDRKILVNCGPLNIPGGTWAVACEGSVAVAQALMSNLDVKQHDRILKKADFCNAHVLAFASVAILLGVVIAPEKSISLVCRVSKLTLRSSLGLVKRIGGPLCRRVWAYIWWAVPHHSRTAATHLQDLLGLFIALVGRLQNRIFKYS